MQACRKGELSAPPIRSGRYFSLHNYWFFVTREGASVGPFDSMAQAEEGVKDYIEFISKAPNQSVDFFTAGPCYAT